jgi:hypothetical protein
LLLAVCDERRGSGHQVDHRGGGGRHRGGGGGCVYEYANDLVRTHGEFGWTARMVSLTVDGLIYAGSMVMLDPARRKAPIPPLAR